MNDSEKLKLVGTLLLIHEQFGVDGFTSFEIGHQVELDPQRVKDWGVVYIRNPHGLPVAKEHPIPDAAALDRFQPPGPKREHLLLHEWHSF